MGCGLLLAALYFLQPVTVFADDQKIVLRGWFLSSADALRGAGLALGEHDQLDPAPGALIPASGVVRLEQAHTISLWVDGAATAFETTERIPANWLARAGLALFPGDQVWVNGMPADPLGPVTGPGPFALQFQPAQPLRVQIDGTERVLYTSAGTLGEALWENDLIPGRFDRLSHPLETRLVADLQVELRRARPLTIRSGELEVVVNTAAATVGEALRESGMAPQGLDATLPGEDEALPAERSIQLVRGRETVALAEELIPFETSYTTTPELELDQREVIQAGRYGVVISRERIRYADEVEVARTREGEWTAAEAQDQIVGMGTQAVVKTLDTGSGTIEYYRAITAYATSYAPCALGPDRCSYITASGAELKKGIVAVSLAWYRLLRGAQVYIPGYGTGVIADNGGGIPGTVWIDLGYSDEDYEAWHQNVTVYFLTPIPANVPAILP